MDRIPTGTSGHTPSPHSSDKAKPRQILGLTSILLWSALVIVAIAVVLIVVLTVRN